MTEEYVIIPNDAIVRYTVTPRADDEKITIRVGTDNRRYR